MKPKTFIPAFALFFALTTVYAQSSSNIGSSKGQPDPARFAEHKQKVLARIQSHMQVMQTLQSCVQAAKDHPAIKACEKTAHDEMRSRRYEGK